MKKRNKKNILVIKANPKVNSYGEALANEYIKGAKESGNKVKEISLRELKLERYLKETHETTPKLTKDLNETRKLIGWADHLVFQYPIWWGTFPALLKEFFEIIFTSGFAFQYQSGKSIPQKLMKDKSARLIVTMDAPKIFTLLVGNKDYKLMKTNVLGFCGIHPVKKSYFHRVRKSTEGQKNAWLYNMYELGKKEF